MSIFREKPPFDITQGKKIIAIVGPTASGKSALAVEVAKKFNGEIISADSRQVYKGLDIGSGKITKTEMHGIPHYLLDVASARRTFTVSQYQKLARQAIKKILAKGNLPIIVGGTGFYIDSLIYDYKLPAVPPNHTLRRGLEKETAEELFLKLKKLDPRRAKAIDRYNKRRLVRALEIVLHTRRPIPRLIRTKGRIKKFDDLKVGIRLPPEEVKMRIKKRLLIRLRQGMIEEVRQLEKQGLSWGRLDELGLEYRYVSRYLRGLISKKEMIRSLEKAIWRYAKRQLTWWRRDKSIVWLRRKREVITAVDSFLKRG